MKPLHVALAVALAGGCGGGEESKGGQNALEVTRRDARGWSSSTS